MHVSHIMSQGQINSENKARLESLQNAWGISPASKFQQMFSCAAVFVSLNNSSIVSFCCFTKISRVEPRLKFKVRGREIGRARQTFHSGNSAGDFCDLKSHDLFSVTFCN